MVMVQVYLPLSWVTAKVAATWCGRESMTLTVLVPVSAFSVLSVVFASVTAQ